MTTWLLSQFLHWQHPGFWLIVSLVSTLLLLGLNRFFPTLRRSFYPIIGKILVPYLGLLVGALSPRLMGLTDLDWVAGLGLGVVLIFVISVLLVLIRTTLHLDSEHTNGDETPYTIFDSVLGAGVQEFHWAFLRAATWEMLLISPMPLPLPAYWAVWIASALALPGIFFQYRTLSQRLIAMVVLMTTAILFFYTRNFWLGWLLHATAQILLGQRPLYLRPLRNENSLR